MNFNHLKHYDKIYITGHHNPDADSLVSAKILSQIFNSLGINAQWAVFTDDNVDKSSSLLLQDCMDKQPLVLKRDNIQGKKFFLVDHNDVMQSVKDVSLALGAIDHHSDSGNFKEPLLSDYCCTALFIYSFFKDSYNFSDIQKLQIFRAFLSDSVFGKSSRYKQKDKLTVEELGFETNFDLLFQKYFVPTDLTDKNKAFGENGVKSYKFPNVEFKSGFVEYFGTEYLSQYKEFIENYNGNFLGIWVDYKESQTHAFFKKDNIITPLEYNFIASRAATILPEILKICGVK